MTLKERILAGALAAGCLLALPAQAAAQSANDPLVSLSEDNVMRALSLIRPQLEIESQANGFLLTLPNGLTGDARLQNCSNRERNTDCRTLSIIVNLSAPEGKSREELLELVNDLNRTDIHGRIFLNSNDEIIARWVFFTTGHETSRGLVTKLIQWDAFVRLAVQALYAEPG